MRQSPDLFGVVCLGAKRRRHHFVANLRTIFPHIALATLGQCAIYSLAFWNGGSSDWIGLATVLLIMSLLPVCAGVVLVSIRNLQVPLTIAALVVLFLFNFAVVSISAVRIPASYTGLALMLPFTISAMIGANIHLARNTTGSVCIFDFPEAKSIIDNIDCLRDCAIVQNPDDPLVDCDYALIDEKFHHSHRWSGALTRLHLLGVPVSPWWQFVERRQRRVDIARFEISHISYTTTQIYYSVVKRGLDILGGIMALPVALALSILVAAYIAAVGGRPIIFKQLRRGYGGREFTILKFRTMHNVGELGQAQPNDHRILFGAGFLRRTRLDELPQILNIIRGEMSWVGPRPIAVPIARDLEKALPVYKLRQLVRPGLTGWAQVSYKYAANFEEEIEKLSYDLYYVKHLSVDLDIMIMIRTISVILRGR